MRFDFLTSTVERMTYAGTEINGLTLKTFDVLKQKIKEKIINFKFDFLTSTVERMSWAGTGWLNHTGFPSGRRPQQAAEHQPGWKSEVIDK